MTLEQLREILGWYCLLNMGILLLWWVFFCMAHDFVYRLHSRWFQLSRERFDAIHYSWMAGFKALIFVFLLVPYLVLHIVA